jgi:hypothetical protein
VVVKQMLLDVDVRAVAIAGAVAGVAYAATMEIDNRLTGQKIDDLLLLGRPIAADARRARRVGALIHLSNSVALGVVYAALARDRLPGPPWLRGVIYGNVETTLLYPLAALDRFHPAVRDGQLDRYWTVAAYLQSVPRHVVYGAVLGSLYERLNRRPRERPGG